MNGDLIKFFPVLLVWPIWLFTVITQNLWYDIFSEYWPATIAMVLGSFIAGSTPLGGGVVAFPIAVLVLGFTSTESRDASVLVQSVGMNAAAFLLLTTKSYLLHSKIIYVNIAVGCCGMLMGLQFNESPELTNLIYTITVLCFGILYFYTNEIDAKWTTKVAAKPKLSHIEHSPSNSLSSMDFTQFTRKDFIGFFMMGLFGLIGGFITASVGSGSDIAVFVFGIYVWNMLYPEDQMDDNIYTASSVVVMGIMSGLTVITRALSVDGFSRETLLCFGAMSFVVVWGAPIGSLVLTPKNLKYLQYMFYVLAIIQFIMFGILKIGKEMQIWIIIMIIVSVIITLLTIHYWFMKRKYNVCREKVAAKSTSEIQPFEIKVTSTEVING